MRRGGRLARRAPLARTVPLPRAEETHARDVVLARSYGGVCELHGDHGGGDWSHRLARSQGGSWAPCNGVRLCRPAHSWAGSARGRRAAEQAGLILRSGQDPAETPVWLPLHGGWVLLDPGGGTTPIPGGPPWRW